MKDPIERQAIINELESWLKVEGYSEGELNIIKAVLYELQSLPSAQQDVTDTNVGDMINRQAAIEALKYNQDVYSHNFHDDPIDKYTTAIIAADIDTLVKLPSAQPEPCGEVVSREVLVKFFDDWMSALDINCHHQSVADLMIIKGDIKNLPSAQSEIIRCKDCRYWREHKYAKETKRYIPFCGFNAIYTEADDYCSKAERRKDG